MNLYDLIFEDENPCWKGYEMIGMKDKGGKKVPNCVPIAEEYDVENIHDSKDFINYMKENYWRVDESTIEEAEYQGRKVKLGKPSQGDVKKSMIVDTKSDESSVKLDEKIKGKVKTQKDKLKKLRG